MAEPDVVQLESITKDYGNLRALDHVSFDIGPGVTGLLGPNGAGKTTLIKVLLGLVSITEGTGQVLGFDLKTQPREIRNRVGYMPEDDCYIAGLTGIEMMQFSARLAGLPAIEGLRRSHEILDFCALQQERYRQVDTYSTGMRQKLKFAQALVHDPSLLILDEPTSGLDPEERQAMLNRIRILATKFDKAVLLSTHILPDVQAICDEVVILAQGALQVQESLDVLRRPSSPAYRVQVMGDGAAFRQRAEREGLVVEEGIDGVLTITGGGDDLPDQVWRWSRECAVPLISLRRARNSLESIFIDAVRGESRANS